MMQRATCSPVRLVDMNTIRQARVAKGWSQQQLAEAAQLSRVTVQRIERGSTHMTQETAASLGAALGLDGASLRYTEGVAGALTQVMAIVNERHATPSELARLPSSERATIAAFQEARAELARSTDALEAAGVAFTKALEGVGQAAALQHAAFFGYLRRIDDEDARAAYEATVIVQSEQQAALTAAQANCSAMGQRQMEALGHFVETGIAVNRLLFRFI